MAKPDLVQCNACGAIFPPVQRDGMTYYHACPSHRVVDDGPVDLLDPLKGRKSRRDPILLPRDENIRVNPDTGKAEPIAVGQGVTKVVDPIVIEEFFTRKDQP